MDVKMKESLRALHTGIHSTSDNTKGKTSEAAGPILHQRPPTPTRKRKTEKRAPAGQAMKLRMHLAVDSLPLTTRGLRLEGTDMQASKLRQLRVTGSLKKPTAPLPAQRAL